MKTNSPRSSHFHRVVSKKEFPFRAACATRLRPLLTLLLLTLPAVVQAQFNYTTENGTITITGYTGPGGAVAIPDTIDGRPVTSIGYHAFAFNASLTSVTIPNSVINIGNAAFEVCASLTSVTLGNSVTSVGGFPFAYCTSLSAITVDALNSFYSSVDGVLFNKSQTLLIQFPGGKAGSYTIPSSVTGIGNFAFAGCTNLTSVTIPNSVTSIGYSAFESCTSLTSITIGNSVTSIQEYAFDYCTSLTGVYFQGNAPYFGLWVFFGSDNATVYHLPGTKGWETTFADRPTELWMLPYPLILNNGPGFGVQADGFSFVISWATNISVVVEASTDLANSAWVPVGTNTLTDGASYFSDPEWTYYPARFYRLRSP